jgi:hypothetical protein
MENHSVTPRPMSFSQNKMLNRSLILGLIILACFMFCGAWEAEIRQSAKTDPKSVSQKLELILEGTITRADHGTYILREFTVPDHIERIEVEYSYTHRSDGVRLDIGIFDPLQFRGWSGGNKTKFFLARRAATPSYRAGDLPPGPWKILLGVAYVPLDTTSHYTISIVMTPGRPESEPEPSPFPTRVIKNSAGWYQGDLHCHTGHSDGSCRNPRGQLAPCPVFKVVQAAAERRLDFLAITDHNTTSHHVELAALQEYFDHMVLVRGQELTTYRGHANVYGTSQYIDFRSGFSGRTINQVIEDVHRAGGLFSINHPSRPTGQQCIGCGWEETDATDFSHVDMIEVVNGAWVAGPLSGIEFWHQRLNEGQRITGIGGSDDHRAGSEEHSDNVMAIPTTVVYATELSEPAILAGLKAGHVFIKTRGPDGPDVYLSAEDGRQHRFMMGDEVRAAQPGEMVTLVVEVNRGTGQMIEVIKNGAVESALSGKKVEAEDFQAAFKVPAQDRAWYRINLRNEKGITVITNPIYVRGGGQ